MTTKFLDYLKSLRDYHSDKAAEICEKKLPNEYNLCDIEDVQAQILTYLIRKIEEDSIEYISVNKEKLIKIIDSMYATGGMCNIGCCLDEDKPCEICPFHERDLDTYKKNVITFLTNDEF
jgi:hypothetical protein